MMLGLKGIVYKFYSLKNRHNNSIDIGILEGVIRTEHDKSNVQLMRNKCKIIVCMGACACYGSVKGLANLFNIDELINRKFLEVESITDKNIKIAHKSLPKFESYIRNIKEFIKVEVFIPGCPPKTENIISALTYLIQYSEMKSKTLISNNNVCDNCDLFNDGCFLENKKLCFGAITAGGCDLMCPNKGEICYGCFGPTEKLSKKIELLEENLFNFQTLNDLFFSNLQKFLSLYTTNTNNNSFYFREDNLQKLAYEPESFQKLKIKTKNGSKEIYNIEMTKNQRINNIIGTCLYLLKHSSNFKFSSKTVCSHCDRNLSNKIPGKLKRDYEGLPNEKECFIEQGYICLGMVTAAGCGGICPNNANAPCHGCYGPPVGIKDQGAQFINTFGSIASKRDIKDIMEIIKDPAGIFNRFTLADSILKHKYNDRIEED